MIEFVLISRLLVDYFWEYKVLSVFHALLAVMLILVCLNRGVRSKVNYVDLCSLAFALYATLVFMMHPEGNGIDFLKVISIFLFYLLGRMSRPYPIRIEVIGRVLLCFIVSMTVIASFNYGFQYWGSIKTFVGGYFFKTDFGVALIIALIFIFSCELHAGIKAFVFLLAVYLSVICNARIMIPLVFLVPLVTYLLSRGWRIDNKFMGVALFFIVFLFTGLNLFNFSDLGLLGFNFDDFFGEENLQGRNWIWGAIIRAYEEYGFFEKAFGGGFSADTLATSRYSYAFHLNESRAHNSYLYVLITSGFLGFSIFLLMLFIWFKLLNLGLRVLSGWERKETIIAFNFLILFLIVSLTTEAVIRAQVTVPLSLMVGRVVLLVSRRKNINE